MKPGFTAEDERKEFTMKKVWAVLLCIIIAFGVMVLPGCSCAANNTTASYSNTENDGHLHAYNHRLSDDKYICEYCGKVYAGDPKNLVEGPPR